MHRVVDISLLGHPEPYRLHEDAYAELSRYLERARARLATDPDSEEVIGDLERSIGEKLTARLSSSKRVVDAADVHAVLEEVGTVDVDADEPAAAQPPTRVTAGRPARRRLYRIREGESLAGVCQGLAAYSDINVSTVRWIFVFLGLVTAGVFFLVYIAMMFILPVVQTREDYLAALEMPEGNAAHR